jgi:homoserine kinase
MVKVRIPATSANVGSGFDSLGLAVTLYNTLHIDEYDGIVVRTLDDTPVPEGECNLVVSSIKQLYEHCGRPFRGVFLEQESPIPLSRGLGSSSACIVGGLLGANQLLGQPMSTLELLDFATAIEGHPDNVAPAFLGGFVTAVFEEGHVHTVALPIPDDLRFVVAIPDFKLPTEQAREALPDSYSRADCIHNISRAALMSAAMQSHRYDLLRVAAGDRLHQPYRLGLIPGGAEMMALMEQNGAYCSYISGAGSAIMAIVPEQDTDFVRRLMEQAQDPRFSRWRFENLKGDNTGAQVWVV